jgi:hypothetical protein
MSRIAAIGLASLLLASVAPAAAQPVLTPGYKVPRLSIGQPDLGGHWSNATLTPEMRPAAMGDRKILTPQEIAQIEGEIVKEIEEGNRVSDPNKPALKVGGELPAADSAFNKPQYVAAGGAVGGYDRGWLDTGDKVMRVAGEPRTSIITTANGRPPPRKAAAPGAAAAGGGRGGGGGPPGGGGQFDNPEIRSLGDRCIISFGRNAGPPMLPNGFYNNNYHIVQSKDAVVIEVEMVHDARVVRLNSEHRKDDVRPWFGDSIGWWQGDTLVVETTHFPQRLAYQGSWEKLKVTERFTRVGPNRLHYAFTVEDPTMWDAAWGGEYEFAPLNGRIAEYACHEGNYALEGILSGARQEERMAAQAAAARPAAR